MKFVALIIIGITVLLTSCSEQAPPADKFVGIWESHSFTMSIEPGADGYFINLDNHRGMLSGQYIGHLVEGRMKIDLPLTGEQWILISEAGDRLDFIGEQLVKVPPGKTVGKSERRQQVNRSTDNSRARDSHSAQSPSS